VVNGSKEDEILAAAPGRLPVYVIVSNRVGQHERQVFGLGDRSREDQLPTQSRLSSDLIADLS
jgi:hypothetical protein